MTKKRKINWTVSFDLWSKVAPMPISLMGTAIQHSHAHGLPFPVTQDYSPPVFIQTLPELFKQRFSHHLPRHSSSKWFPLDAEHSTTASLKESWIFNYLSHLPGGISQSICWLWPVPLGVTQRIKMIKRWSQFLPGIRNTFPTSKRAWMFDEQGFSANFH